MNTQRDGRRWTFDTPMPAKWAAVVAYAMVVIVFLGDWFSPTSVVVDVAYEAPVVFAALKGTPRLTFLTVILGVFGILLGWYMDYAQAAFVLNEIRVENRLLVVLSLLIVGSLSIVVQRNAKRETALDFQRVIRREAMFSAAVERVTSALSTGTTVEAITVEASKILGASAAVWCSTQRDARVLAAGDGESDSKVLFAPTSVEFENLLQRLASQRGVEILNADESIDFLVGKTVASTKALAIPIGQGTTSFGVLFVSLEVPHVDEATLAIAANFARFASNAMVQASYVADVVARNDGSSHRAAGLQGLA